MDSNSPELDRTARPHARARIAASWGSNASEPGSLQIIAYYAVFWLPAGVASVLASAVLLGPARTLWRASSPAPAESGSRRA